MTATDRANELAWAVQDGTNCLFALRALRADPPVVSAAELEEWGAIFDRTQSAFAELQIEIQAGKAWTSIRLTSTLVRSFAEVRTHLAEIAPGAHIPATLFELVEVAWSEVTKTEFHGEGV